MYRAYQNKFFVNIKMPPTQPILVNFKRTLTEVGYDAITFVTEPQKDMTTGKEDMFYLNNLQDVVVLIKGAL